MFKERLGLKELQNMSELLTRDRPNFWLTMWTDVKLKCFIFEKGLRMDTMFKERLALKEPQNMSEPLTRDRWNFWSTKVREWWKRKERIAS
jgi:hypothetical protein